MSIRVNGKVIASNGDVKTETDNLVTTDTNQTITSTKVFTAEQQKKSTVIDITTQPEKYTANNAFRFLDKNGQITGYIENGQMASGEITTGIHAKNKEGYQPHVSVFAPLTGMTGAYAIAPSTPANPINNAIVTADYLKNKYVDLNTNQTITGRKVFTNELLRKSTNIDVTSKATSDTFNTLVRFKDKNGKELGAVNNAQMNGGNIRTVLEARNKDNYVPTIGVQAPYEGSTGGFGYAPNTPANAPANAIATVDYVNNIVASKTDKVQAAASMPSDRYIDITLGGSRATYTAPANGWFYLKGPTGASGYIGNDIIGIVASGTNNFGLNVLFPVRKDETVNVLYTEANTLRFIYAQGEQ